MGVSLCGGAGWGVTPNQGWDTSAVAGLSAGGWGWGAASGGEGPWQGPQGDSAPLQHLRPSHLIGAAATLRRPRLAPSGANLSLQAMKQEHVMVPQMVLINLPLGAPRLDPELATPARALVLPSLFFGGGSGWGIPVSAARQQRGYRGQLDWVAGDGVRGCHLPDLLALSRSLGPGPLPGPPGGQGLRGVPQRGRQARPCRQGQRALRVKSLPSFLGG